MGGAVSSFGKTIKGIAGLAGGAIGAGLDVFTGGVLSPPKVPGTPDAPAREDPAVQEARRKALAQENQARGRRSTLLTGGRGVTGEALVQRARLLGGTA